MSPLTLTLWIKTLPARGLAAAGVLILAVLVACFVYIYRPAHIKEWCAARYARLKTLAKRHIRY